MDQPSVPVPLHLSPSALIRTIAQQFPSALARSTMANYLRLASHLEIHAGTHSLDPLADSTWVQVAHSLDVAPSGRLAHLKAASVVHALRARSPLSLALAQSCAQRQAPSRTRAHLDHPLLAPHRLGLLLAWKTALRLRRRHISLHAQQSEFIVDWSQHTKSSRTDPHRSSRFAVIRGLAAQLL
jgi:hypothetical protein